MAHDVDQYAYIWGWGGVYAAGVLCAWAWREAGCLFPVILIGFWFGLRALFFLDTSFSRPLGPMRAEPVRTYSHTTYGIIMTYSNWLDGVWSRVQIRVLVGRLAA